MSVVLAIVRLGGRIAHEKCWRAWVRVLRLTLDLLVLSGHHQEMIRIFDVGIGIVQVQPVHVEQVVACDALGCKLALTVSELRLWYA